MEQIQSKALQTTECGDQVSHQSKCDNLAAEERRGQLSIVCTKGTEQELYQILVDTFISGKVKPGMSGIVVEVETDRQISDPEVIAWNKQKLNELLEQPNKISAADWKPSRKFKTLVSEGLPYTLSEPNPELPQRELQEPDLICMADVEQLDVAWWWNKYIAIGSMVSFQGDPGAGKSQIAGSIGAMTTRGERPPDANGKREKCEPRNILLINGEDALNYTIAPRLDRAGADMNRAFTLNLEKDPLDFTQIERIENAIKQINPILVIFDPIQQFLGAGVDMHRANEVRPVLARLKDLAARYEFVCIMVQHMNKYGGGKAQYRGLGSIDISAIMRAQFLIGENRNVPGGRLILPIKNSLGELQPAQGFTISDEGITWTDTDWDATEQDILTQANAKEGTALNEAMIWLREIIEDAPVWSTDLDVKAEAAGISARTLSRARKEMKDSWEIVNKKAPGLNKWYWAKNHTEVTFATSGGLDYV